MKRNLSNSASAFVIGIGCVTLMAALSVTAHSQGISAQATTTKPDPTRDIATLRQQLQALEKRVAELEKGELEESKGDVEADASAKKLEQRLAQLERAAATKGDDKAGNKTQGADDDDPMTVRAPFVVQDDGGRTIFRVDTVPGGGRSRIMVGNPIGARAEIGPNELGGAVVAIYDSTNSLRVALAGQPAESELRLRGSKTVGVHLRADGIGGDVHLFNAAGLGSARLSIGNGGAGNFMLGDAGGATVVSAGTMANGIGIIKAGPGGFGPAGVTGGVMPASSIQGRK